MPRFHQLLAFVTILGGTAAATDPRAAHAEPVEVVAFGDSLSAGYGVGPGESFPDQLGRRLRAAGHDVRVVNAGVSGDTTQGGLARLDWSVPASADVVIVELGANDALRGVAPAVTRRNLDAILASLTKRPNTQVILAGMIAPPNLGGSYGRDFNPIYTDLAAKYRVPLYPFFLDGVAAISRLNLADGMHPNAEGIGIIVDRILPEVEAAVERAQRANAS